MIWIKSDGNLSVWQMRSADLISRLGWHLCPVFMLVSDSGFSCKISFEIHLCCELRKNWEVNSWYHYFPTPHCTTLQILRKHIGNSPVTSVIYITSVLKSKRNYLNKQTKLAMFENGHAHIFNSNSTFSAHQHNSCTDGCQMSATSWLKVMEVISDDRWHFFHAAYFSDLDWCAAAESLFLLSTLRSKAVLWSRRTFREPDPQRTHSRDSKTCSQSKHSHTGYQGGHFSQLLMARYEA